MKTVLSPAHLKRIKKKGAAVIRVEPYGSEIVVFTSMDSLVEHFEFVFQQPSEIDDEFLTGQTYGLAFSTATEDGIVYCIAFDKAKYREETIWHEALHATVDILNGHGVHFTPDNHEPFAYTQGYLVGQIRQKVYGLPGFTYED